MLHSSSLRLAGLIRCLVSRSLGLTYKADLRTRQNIMNIGYFSQAEAKEADLQEVEKEEGAKEQPEEYEPETDY